MSETPPSFRSAHQIASDIRRQEYTATDVIEYFIARIAEINPAINAYTEITAQRAREKAQQIDQCIARGEDPGPLAGVPFAVKNLFDIESVVTLAGSKINADNAPANKDAVLIQRMENAGAILLGGLNMGEYAYDFTGENVHHGNCLNPWDLSRMSGGSSSGSGSATAAGIAPISLGSDTNGSIRVPASLCGIFGLKPTYGRLPRSGSYPFCDSLDHLGPLARNTTDLALSFDAMQGHDADDHACADKPRLNTYAELSKGIDGLRIARAGGYFATSDFPQAEAAVDQVCAILGVDRVLDIPGAAEGRAAAFLITNMESSALHLSRLQTRAQDYDPDTRDRFLAGALLPAAWYIRAQQVRHWYQQQVLALFDQVDVLIAPATPCSAPRTGEKILHIAGQPQPLRPNLGYFTQPISAIGLPVCVVPTQDNSTGMPVGVQIIAAPWREDICLRVAAHLEKLGLQAAIPTGIGGNTAR